MDEKKVKGKQAFSSPLLMAICLIAASVGTGNIWRFPRVAASNGGAAFIIAYVVIMIVAIIPVMMGEHCIGRSTRKALPGAFRDFMGSKKATWFGSFVSWVVVITIAYYTVVVAWIFIYLFKTITGELFVTDTQVLFDSISNHNIVSVVIFIAIQAFCCWAAAKGIKAIESSTKILLPILFVCVVVLAIFSLSQPGATAGLNFLFNLNPKDLLSSKVWLEALTQCLWSAGPGWGICIAYGVYAKRKSDVALATTVQGFGDMSIALLAGIAIIPALFSGLGEEGALAACASGNNGLAFVALSSLFGKMAGGRFVAILFWAALICASITSIIAMYSMAFQPLTDMKISRKKSALIMGIVTIVIGIPSCWDINIFSNQDFVVGMGMVIAATFSSVALLKFGANKVRTTFINNPWSALNVGGWWNISSTWVLMILAAVMFIWWCVLSVGWNPDWYNPLGVYSLATMVAQLGLAGLVLGLFNKRIAEKSGPCYFNGKDFPETLDDE